MANSRKSGDNFEYHITKALIDYNSKLEWYDEKSKIKLNKLKEKITNDDINLTKNKLTKLFQYLQIDKYTKIKFTQDNDGKKNNVSDIELYDNDGNKIGFSLKKNNISIKHPRPSSFDKQCNLNEATSKEYKESYAKINNILYEINKKSGTFDKISKDDKNKLYLEINNNTKKYLEILSSDEVHAFWKFLINYEHVYILQYDTNKKQIILYNYIDIPDPKTIKSIKVEDNHIIICFDNDINIDLRLHNASKKITKTLSLKYDTKILNHEKLFTHCIYEL